MEETKETHFTGDNDQESAEDQQVHQIDKDQREEGPVLSQVRLVLEDHPAGEGEVETPGGTNGHVKDP